MKINTKQTLKNLAGNDIKTLEDKVLTVGESISNILLSAKEGGKMKLYVMAQKFYTDEEIEVDDADLTLVTKAIESTESGYTALITGQLLILLSKK